MFFKSVNSVFRLVSCFPGTPALLISRLIEENLSLISESVSSILSESSKSTSTYSILSTPTFLSFDTADSALALSLAPKITLHPCLAMVLLRAKPIPLFAPVMKTVFIIFPPFILDNRYYKV